MDISKLPKFSQTRPEDAPHPVATDDAADAARPPGSQPSPVHVPGYDPAAAAAAPVYAEPGGPEAWISFAMCGLILLLNPRLLQYLLAPATFQSKYTITDEHGAPLAYAKSIFFWNDIALTSFALVMALDGIVLLAARRKPAIVLTAFVVTVVATLANLLYLVMTFNSYGIAIFSAIAVAYGGYIAIHQWRLFLISSAAAAAARESALANG